MGVFDRFLTDPVEVHTTSTDRYGRTVRTEVGGDQVAVDARPTEVWSADGKALTATLTLHSTHTGTLYQPGRLVKWQNSWWTVLVVEASPMPAFLSDLAGVTVRCQSAQPS